jgi:hypothetical protein
LSITFGIVTDGKSDDLLSQSIESIRKLKIEDYEIVVVGDTSITSETDLRVYFFDETIKQGWITRKKNLVTHLAKSKYIVYLHDYIFFDIDWYKNFKKTQEFNVGVCEIINRDGERYRDWTLWVENGGPFDTYIQRTRQTLLPYSIKTLSPYMYISGAFWVARREFMLQNPLNENLVWGQMEDVEWSKRVREKTSFVFLKNAKVYLLRQKNVEFVHAKLQLVKALIQFLEKGAIKFPHKIEDEFNDLDLVPRQIK